MTACDVINIGGPKFAIHEGRFQLKTDIIAKLKRFYRVFCSRLGVDVAQSV